MEELELERRHRCVTVGHAHEKHAKYLETHSTSVFNKCSWVKLFATPLTVNVNELCSDLVSWADSSLSLASVFANLLDAKAGPCSRDSDDHDNLHRQPLQSQVVGYFWFLQSIQSN